MKLLFLDLETSDFDPRKGEILECYAQTYDVVNSSRGSSFHKIINWPEEVLRNAWNQHDENHLKQDCRQSQLHWVTFKEEFSAYLTSNFGTSLARLAGFSPHFDLSWLHAKLAMKDRLAHRVFDISTIRDWLGAMQCGELLPNSSKEYMCHRAKADVEVAMKTLDMARLLLPPAYNILQERVQKEEQN